MGLEYHKQILTALRERGEWEQKQRLWYALAMQGLRRKKTARWQSDMFWPLVDSAITQFIPFYYNQLYAQERLCNFTSQAQQLDAATESAADYLDWTIKQDHRLDQCNQFEREILMLIGLMLLYGRGTLKTYWNANEGRLAWEAVHPLSLIVPRCKSLFEADNFAQVIQLTPAAYRRDRRYVQDPELLKRITGGRVQADQAQSQADQDAAMREGLTFSSNENTIILWENYERTPGGWTVRTYSPTAPEIQVRRPFGLLEKFRGEPFLPFITFTMEVIDGGWYAPRGLAERLAPFQQYLCRLWSEKVDSMTFWNRPLFTASGPLGNTANVTWEPGDVIPNGISAVQMPQPAISFDVEMEQTRSIAQQTIGTPDAAVPNPMKAGGKSSVPTATQVDFQRALASTGVDLRGRIFRLSLGELYRKNWALLLNHRSEDMAYFAANQRRVLPPEALHEHYLIEPAGSPDNWNKTAKVQRAANRLQAFQGNPMVKQDELVKDLIAADDARAVDRLFVSPQNQGASEMEAEGARILLAEAGFPVQVQPNEDHAARLRVDFGRLAMLQHLGRPVDPVAKTRLMQLVAQHFSILKQQNPMLARQIEAAVADLEQPGEGEPMPAMNPEPAMEVNPT